jgi:hypothetical protein
MSTSSVFGLPPRAVLLVYMARIMGLKASVYGSVESGQSVSESHGFLVGLSEDV